MADTAQLKEMKAALQARMPLAQVNKALLISLRNNFVFARVPKVANSSLKHLIYDMERMPNSDPIRDNMIHDNNYGPVIRPAMLGFASPLLHRALFSERFLRFTFVRNPYAKALSNYLDRYMDTGSTVRRVVNRTAVAQGVLSDPEGEVSFSAYLRAVEEMGMRGIDIHISPQSTQTLADLVRYEHVGAFETLAEDMAALAKRIWGKEDVALGFKSPSRTNATARLQEMCSDADVACINRLYEEDFATFGYRMLDRVADFADDSVVLRVQTGG